MITNRTVKGILDDFCKQYNIHEQEDKSFEFLVNFVALSGFEFTRQIDIDLLRRVDVDPDGGTFGIDSVQFFVNDNIIFSPADLDIYIKSNTLKVDIVFVQSKTSPKFDIGDILKATTAAKDFLKHGSRNIANCNENLKNAYNIYTRLFTFECSQHLDRDSPHVHIFYVTTAESTHKNVINFCSQQVEDLKSSVPDIKNFTIKALGSNYIIDMYKESVNVVTANFNFKNRLELDSIQGVSSSFIGYIDGSDFVNIITDPQGDLRKWIFYDNVRDFQGIANPVNMEIDRTIKNIASRDKFLLFNNGVTIVAKTLKPLGSNNFTIKDYQIVNGCQTSNVIFNNRGVSSSIKIPIKIIITEDDALIFSIVKANNRQTPVSDEQFLTLDAFHRRLQDAYEAYSKDMPIKIFYERRVGEARNNENLLGFNVVSLHGVIRCITATAFHDAYVVYNNNPANILRNRTEKLFKEDHILEAYYVGSYLLSLFTDLHSKEVFHCSASDKYYIILIVFIVLCNDPYPINLSSRETKKTLQGIVAKLKSENMGDIFCNAVKFLSKIKKEFRANSGVDILRDRSFNKKIVSDLQGLKPSNGQK